MRLVSAHVKSLSRDGFSWISFGFHFGFASCKVNWAQFGVGFSADGENLPWLLERTLKNTKNKREKKLKIKSTRKKEKQQSTASSLDRNIQELRNSSGQPWSPWDPGEFGTLSLRCPLKDALSGS